MGDVMPDDLWRDFPKTAPSFEARFRTDEDYHAHWIKARRGGKQGRFDANATGGYRSRLGATLALMLSASRATATDVCIMQNSSDGFVALRSRLLA